MKIKVREVKSKKDLKAFIYLPEKLYKNDPNWIPPIYMDEFEYFNPKKNKGFSYCDTILLLAELDGEIVGRVMGLINHKYNKLRNEKHARFAFLHSIDSIEIVRSMMDAIETWANDKGMEKLVGPLAFSDKDPQGFLIKGFEEPVVIASNWNLPYLPEHFNSISYEKEVDLVVYKVPIQEELPDFYVKIAERFENRNNELKVLEFTKRSQVKPYIRPVLKLANKTFKDIYGFVPYTEKEMDDFANRYLFLINPNFIKVVTNENNEVVAFVVGMSDIGKGIKKAKGRMFPFGIFKILNAGKKSKQLNLLLGGIDPDYRGRGLDVQMGIRILKSAHKLGKEIMDSHLELETNKIMRAEMEKLGGEEYKRYRIFQKNLM
jgi:hypothetical protein